MSKMFAGKLCKGLLWEFHYSKFFVTYNSWRAFSFTPWLPHKWSFQLIYLLYRWIVYAFLSISVFIHGFDIGSPNDDNAMFFLYMTNWMLVLFTFYSLWAAISVTASYFTVFLFHKDLSEEPEEGGPCNHELIIDDRPLGCCGLTSDATMWHHKILWVLYSTSIHMSIVVCLFYWITLFDPSSYFTYYGNIFGHFVVGIIAITDVYFTSIPWRILHVVYPMIFASVWVIFSGIYYAAGGTNDAGDRYIYPDLDYMNNTVGSAVICLATVFVALPLVHVVIYCFYLTRELLLFLAKKFCCSRCCREETENEESKGKFGAKREILNQEPYSP